jgi:predicted aldo/keto reductase-like oxidoreductase
MLYRELGKTGREVSVLGFGCMRLPLKYGLEKATDVFDPTKPIDEDQATAMIHYAIDQGVNYFDTAYPYHGGQSEAFLGKALSGYRDRVMLATKSPIWLVETPMDFDRFLDEQLEKLNSSFLDFYLLHSLGRRGWQKMKALGALDFLDRIRKDGRARYVGFSFHDDVKIFKEIVEGYHWDMCQIQYNYFDEHYQAGKEGLQYAASKGLGVVVMEPLRGGKLTGVIPAEVKALWDSAAEERTPAEWALRWVWNHPEVSTALSGVSTMAQIEENIRIADKAVPNSLMPAHLKLIDRVTRTYRSMVKINCTGCAYCVPCPNGVDIPLNFSLYNDTFMFRDSEIAYMMYTHFVAPEQRASNCAECGECEEHCPQHLEIREELKKVHQRFSQG